MKGTHSIAAWRSAFPHSSDLGQQLKSAGRRRYYLHLTVTWVRFFSQEQHPLIWAGWTSGCMPFEVYRQPAKVQHPYLHAAILNNAYSGVVESRPVMLALAKMWPELPAQTSARYSVRAVGGKFAEKGKLRSLSRA
jgi:hypothetical protein